MGHSATEGHFVGGYRGIAGGIRITLLAQVKVFKTPPGL
jgi:hypothetical protein